MTAGIIIFLVILLLPVTLTAVHYFRRTIELGRALDRANERRREITNFLSRFSTGLQEEDGVEGAMHAAARHVAEQTDAESVAIYEVSGNELRVTGVCGTYPLIHSSNQLLFSRHHHLFEALRREEVPIGKGFLGGMATTRQAELVPDAAADPRFVEYPDFANFGSIMAIPLLREGMLVGVVCAATNRLRPGSPFSEAQFERLRLLSGQVQMVQNLVKVYSEISKRERIDQELEFARHLQQSLLPQAFPAWDQF